MLKMSDMDTPGGDNRYLYHASLLVAVFVGLLTLLGILLKWRGERHRKKALKKHTELFNSWLSRRRSSLFQEAISGNPFYLNALNQGTTRDSRNEWSVRFSKLTTSPNSLLVSVNSLAQEDTHMDVWVDIRNREGSFIELQVDSQHPTHGHVGCTLSVRMVVMKLKASFVEQDGFVFLTTNSITPSIVNYQMTKKHPINVPADGLESLNQCLDRILSGLSLYQFPLHQANGHLADRQQKVKTPHQEVDTQKHELNGQKQELDKKQEVYTRQQEVTHEDQPASELSSHSVVSQTTKDYTHNLNSLRLTLPTSPDDTTEHTPDEENVDSGLIQPESRENSEAERNMRSHSLSPTTPSSPWRRTRSYENLEHIIEVTPPTPKNPVPIQLQHSTSVIETVRSPGSLPHPNPNKLKRPISSVLPMGSSNSLNGASSDNDSLSLSNATDSSSEDTSVTSASDVSMTVYEVKEGGSIKHIVVEKSKLFKKPPHSRKLHLFNGHVFAATHFKRFRHSVGPLTCSSCKKRVHGIVGKQAYQCRDCKMIVHKNCHGLVSVNCPKSSIESMILLYQTSDPD